jgi:hypothetical protein
MLGNERSKVRRFFRVGDEDFQTFSAPDGVMPARLFLHQSFHQVFCFLRMAAILALLLLAMAQGAAAQEHKPWYKDWQAWLVAGASIASSVAMTHEAHACRERFGPAPCSGGYGEFKAREIVRGVTSIGMTAISLWGRHQGFKEWPVPALGFAAYNGIAAYRQTLVGCPPGEVFVYGTKFSCTESYGGWGNETHVDMSGVVPVRH